MSEGWLRYRWHGLWEKYRQLRYVRAKLPAHPRQESATEPELCVEGSMKRRAPSYGPRIPVCTICGEEKSPTHVWFLVTESYCEDKLRILQWQDDIAEREGMYGACCPAHVEELVIHWMTTGSLDFPFATTASPVRVGRRVPLAFLPMTVEPDTRGARQIGELAVHRESMGRLPNESPDSLQLILDELTRALQRESTSDARFDSSDCVASGMLRPA